MKKTRVLVVDDDVDARELLSLVLSQAGFQVDDAPDGFAALAKVSHVRPDAVLTDLRMPGMDGMTVLEMMKSRWPESEVVIVTGYPSVETAKQAVRLGAFDYLEKPVGPDEIIGAARGAITRKQWAMRDHMTRSIS